MAFSPRNKTDVLREAAAGTNLGNLTTSITVPVPSDDGQIMKPHTIRFIEADFLLLSNYYESIGSNISVEFRRIVKREIAENHLKR